MSATGTDGLTFISQPNQLNNRRSKSTPPSTPTTLRIGFHVSQDSSYFTESQTKSRHSTVEWRELA